MQNKETNSKNITTIPICEAILGLRLVEKNLKSNLNEKQE